MQARGVAAVLEHELVRVHADGSKIRAYVRARGGQCGEIRYMPLRLERQIFTLGLKGGETDERVARTSFVVC